MRMKKDEDAGEYEDQDADIRAIGKLEGLLEELLAEAVVLDQKNLHWLKDQGSALGVKGTRLAERDGHLRVAMNLIYNLRGNLEVQGPRRGMRMRESLA